MNTATDPSTFALILVNLMLGVFCLGCVIAVSIAVALDVAERRRWRRSIPNGWPPDEPAARSRPIEASAVVLPDCWPPQQEKART